MTSTTISGLQFLASKTQVDLDSLDVEAARKGILGRKFTDATSNPIEVYSQLAKPENQSIVDDAKAFCHENKWEYEDISFSELAFEVATVLLACRILPLIDGCVHIMCNPQYSFSTAKVIAAAWRYHELFRRLDPTIDFTRVVIKVPATWEALQAAGKLNPDKIKTLGTMVFTMEQVILAGAAGCTSISPFIHELKTGVDPTYRDDEAMIDLCHSAQDYYMANSVDTRVKVCSATSVDEIIDLAGVSAHTIEKLYIDALSEAWREEGTFLDQAWRFDAAKRISGPQKYSGPLYLHDEHKYRVDFAASLGGRGQMKLFQAITIFCDYQWKGEMLFKDAAADDNTRRMD